MINIAKPIIGQEEINAVIKVMESGAIASGAKVTEFENDFAEYLRINHAIAASSGTTALEVALKAAGIKKGDKIITTPFSFIASTNAIVYSGAIPVFADIDENTFDISPDSIEKVLENEGNIRALLIVHLYGQSCNMDWIMEIVKRHNLILIEDCAQAHGAEWSGQKVGTFGDVAAFSFYPTKNMTTAEGGMVVTNDQAIAKSARQLINHGMETRYFHDSIGYNYRMTNIAAAIGVVQVKKLDLFNQVRQRNAEFYNKNISNEAIVKPYCDTNGKHVYHQYTLRIKQGRREQFIKLLEENEIGYGVYYPLSIPEQKCYDRYGFSKNYPITDRIKNEIISIPIHPSLTEDEIEKIVNVMNSFGG